MFQSLYVDSIIARQHDVALNRELEYRRIAEERGTIKISRRPLTFLAQLLHRPARHGSPRRTLRHA